MTEYKHHSDVTAQTGSALTTPKVSLKLTGAGFGNQAEISDVQQISLGKFCKGSTSPKVTNIQSAASLL